MEHTMELHEVVAARIRQLCDERGITPNNLSHRSAVHQSTVKSILNGESKNPGMVTLQKLCDGLEITIGEFFNTPEFEGLDRLPSNVIRITPAPEIARAQGRVIYVGPIKFLVT